MTMKTFLTRLEAADEAGVSEGFIKKEIREGRLIARKIGRRLTRIHCEEFHAWAKRQPVKIAGSTTGHDGSRTENGENQVTEKTVHIR